MKKETCNECGKSVNEDGEVEYLENYPNIRKKVEGYKGR